jgi:hypothetical protein
MKYKKTIRFGAFAVCLGASAAFVGAATGATGAFFSDTKSGKITGRSGSIKITTSGGTGPDSLDLKFDGLLPGEPQSLVLNYQNTGDSPQDVWLTFPNVPALHALNNLGRFGELTIVDTSAGQLFHSTNLNDGRTVAPPLPTSPGLDSCGPLSSTGGACWPLPTKLLLRTALAKNGSGSVTITFRYQEPPDPVTHLPVPTENNTFNVLGGTAFNSYPLTSQAFGPDAAGPAGEGLPFRVVAMQVGHAPTP